MKMMPGQEPYTQEERKRLDDLMRAACEAEVEVDIDELERFSMKIEDVKNKALRLGLEVHWSNVNQAWFVMEHHMPGAVGDKRKVLKVGNLEAVADFLNDYERI